MNLFRDQEDEMQGIKILTTSGEVKFIACYYYERKGDKLVTLCENNEIKYFNNIQEVKEI